MRVNDFGRSFYRLSPFLSRKDNCDPEFLQTGDKFYKSVQSMHIERAHHQYLGRGESAKGNNNHYHPSPREQ